jgi:hypothetical protein
MNAESGLRPRAIRYTPVPRKIAELALSMSAIATGATALLK